MIELVNMPFGSVMRAPMAIGQFKSQLSAAGIASRAHHLNFAFAHAIGFGAYETVARFKGVETQVSEWLFADAAWRRPLAVDPEEFLRLSGEELHTIPNVPDPATWLRKVRREIVPLFLERALARLCADGPPAVVAFSCMFFQTVAALALGRLLKERHPEITLAYGGACFFGEMGEELFSKVPWIDVAATGEADEAVVPLFAALAAGERPTGLPGIHVRARDGRVFVGPAPMPTPATALATLPDPDHGDFFADARAVGLLDDAVWRDRASLPFEASRGCWWGEKKHCTFCGLNGDGMAFRLKPPDVVLAMLRRMAGAYPVRNFQATDNIMAMSYFESFLPQLADATLTSAGGKVDLFFEVKPNLTRAQIAALARANIVYVQPGIESLSSHLLRVIDKGVTALQNVFFLKCATELGLLVIWNLLVRIPGEALDDYRQMEQWIPRLVHLRPPTGGAPRVECHRYSPYFTRHERWVTDVRPARWYRGIFPDDEIDLRRVAYYFDVTWKDTLGEPVYDGVTRAAHQWMQRWRQSEVPRLSLRPLAVGAEIEDTRGDRPVVWQLDETQARVYAAIADIATPRKVEALLQGAVGEREARSHLLRFVADGLALEENDRFLGLAVPPTTLAPSLARRQVQMRRVTNQLSPQAAGARPVHLPLAEET